MPEVVRWCLAGLNLEQLAKALEALPPEMREQIKQRLH
jgi:hypothetical protein